MEVDNKIIEGCISGDKLSQYQMYKKLHGLMLRIAFRYTNDRDTAVEYMNVSFCNLLNKVHKYDFKTPFSAWVRVLIKNGIIDEYRRQKKYNCLVSLDSVVYRIGDGMEDDSVEYTATKDFNNSVENLVERKMSMERVEFMLKGLAEKTREVVKMQILEGFTHKQISKILGITESASKWHLVEGKKYLRINCERFLKLNLVVPN